MPLRKISRGSPEFMKIINHVADISNIQNIDYDIQYGCDDVDCYIGGIYKVRLSGYRFGQKIKKNYLIKWHSEPKNRSTWRESYKREYFFYQAIVPKMLEVEKTINLIEGLKIKFPNCVFGCIDHDKEVIVLSNPQYEGYTLFDRLRQLDLDHVSLVMKNLAKLHALSFVLEKSRPADFDEIKRACCTDVQYSDTDGLSKSMSSFYNESVEVVTDDDTRKKLQDIGPCIPLILNKCAMPKLSKYMTICHGDCWNNNVIYKYQNGKPVDAILVDYQVVRYASPVTDVAYYLYMSTDQQFLSEHYERMLILYHRTLSAILRQFGFSPKEIYPEETFREHLKVYSVLGLIEALVSMKIITAEPEVALKMTEAKYEFASDEIYEKETQNNSFYVERVNGVVNEFFSRNYSLDMVIST